MSSEEEDFEHDYDDGASIASAGGASAVSHAKASKKIVETFAFKKWFVMPCEENTPLEEIDEGLNPKYLVTIMEYWNKNFANEKLPVVKQMKRFPDGLIDFLRFDRDAAGGYRMLFTILGKMDTNNPNGVRYTNALKGFTFARVITDPNDKVKKAHIAPGTVCKAREDNRELNEHNPIQPLAWRAFSPKKFMIARYIQIMAEKIEQGGKVVEKDLQVISDLVTRLKDGRAAYSQLSEGCPNLASFSNKYEYRRRGPPITRVSYFTALHYNNKDFSFLAEMGMFENQLLPQSTSITHRALTLEEIGEFRALGNEAVQFVMDKAQPKLLKRVSNEEPSPKKQRREKAQRRSRPQPRGDSSEEDAEETPEPMLNVRDGTSQTYMTLADIISDALKVAKKVPVDPGMGGAAADNAKILVFNAEHHFDKHPLVTHIDSFQPVEWDKVYADFRFFMFLVLKNYSQLWGGIINADTSIPACLAQNTDEIKRVYHATDKGLENLAKLYSFAEIPVVQVTEGGKTFCAICVNKAAKVIRNSVRGIVTNQNTGRDMHTIVCKILNIHDQAIRDEIDAKTVVSFLYSFAYMLIRKMDSKCREVKGFDIPPAFKNIETRGFPPMPDSRVLFAETDPNADNSIPDYADMSMGGQADPDAILKHLYTMVHRVSFRAHSTIRVLSKDLVMGKPLMEEFIFFASIASDETLDVVTQFLYLGGWFDTPVFINEGSRNDPKFKRAKLSPSVEATHRSVMRWIQNNIPQNRTTSSIPGLTQEMREIIVAHSWDIAFNANALLDKNSPVHSGIINVNSDVLAYALEEKTRFKGDPEEDDDAYHRHFLEFIEGIAKHTSVVDQIEKVMTEQARGFFFLTQLPAYYFEKTEMKCEFQRIQPVIVETVTKENIGNYRDARLDDIIVKTNPRFLHFDLEGDTYTPEEEDVEISDSELDNWNSYVAPPAPGASQSSEGRADSQRSMSFH